MQPGNYQLSAKATDNLGQTSTSAVANITITNNAAPTVSINAPANNTSYSAPASINLSATAADSDGTIAKVEFYNGNTVLGTATTAPYNYNWTNVQAGNYSITAKATDNQGASTVSAPVNVNVAGAAAQIYYVHNDQINTPRSITDSAGREVWQWQGDAFGAQPPNQNPKGAGEFEFNLRMPGQYYDKETNLFQNYFRDYDPSTGRYVQSDPIGLAGGVNTFAYVKNQPNKLTDPTGEFAQVMGRGAWWAGVEVGIAINAGIESVATVSLGILIYNAVNSCNEDPCKQLNNDVQAAKDKVAAFGFSGGAACRPGMSRWELAQRHSAWLELATARSKRDQKCWAGGDSGHQIAHAAAWAHVGNCTVLLK